MKQGDSDEDLHFNGMEPHMKPNFKGTSSEGRMNEATQKTSGCSENVFKVM